MKYYINGRFLTQKITGVQRFAEEMTKSLDAIIEKKQSNDEYILIAPNQSLHKIDCRHIKIYKCGYLKGHLWEQLELPYYSRDGFLLNFCNCAPLIKENQAVVIHDAAVVAMPNTFSFLFRAWYNLMFFILGKRVKKIFTVSKFSAGELVKYFDYDWENIIVTYNGASHLDKVVADKRIIKKIGSEKAKYILAVSSLNPSKNFQLLIETANKMPNLKFVFVGTGNSNVFKNCYQNEQPNIIYTGYVTDGELKALYQHATAFVYPSLYEGFGIPPLEAMYFGCPVIVSDCASLPEVCGDAALYCSPYDSDMLRKKIEKILMDKSLSDAMKQKGLERVNNFRWDNEAMKIFCQIQDVTK